MAGIDYGLSVLVCGKLGRSLPTLGWCVLCVFCCASRNNSTHINTRVRIWGSQLRFSRLDTLHDFLGDHNSVAPTQESIVNHGCLHEAQKKKRKTK